MTAAVLAPRNIIAVGDTLARLKELPDESIDMVITSPPYWGLRDYGTGVWSGGSADCDHVERNARNDEGRKAANFHGGHEAPQKIQYSKVCAKCGAERKDDQLGQEPTYTEYLDKLLAIFAEVKRVLKPTGTCWVNLGDTYNSSKKGNTNGTYGSVKQKAGINDMQIDKQRQRGLPAKTLCGIPARFALRMVDELGFSLRNDIIWHKPNSMPQSVKDRFAVDYEHLYFFVKSPKYFFETQYEPLSPVTLKELEKAYTGQATKDYASAGAQNASDVKRRILKGLTANMGGGGTGLAGHKCQLKADGTPIVKGAFDTFDQAKALGWQPEVESYGEWYFNTRQKKGWHDHAADAEQGNGQQKRGHTQPKLEHPLGRVKRSVWRISVRPFKGAHFAVFPEQLIETPILAGCPQYVCTICGQPRRTVIAKQDLTGMSVKDPCPTCAKPLSKHSIGTKNKAEQGGIRPPYTMSAEGIPLKPCNTDTYAGLSGCTCGSHNGVCDTCGKPLAATMTETRHATRPGNDVGNGKSGTDSDPNAALHNSDLSKYREAIVRTVDTSIELCTCTGKYVPGVVLDPFIGAGTTALVAKRLGRDYIGIDLKQEYVDMALKRIGQV